MLAHADQRAGPDVAELGRREARQGAPHVEDLVHRRFVVLRLRIERRPAVTHAGAEAVGGRGAVPGPIGRLEPVGCEVGPERHQMPDAPGVVDGEVEPDIPAITPAHDVDPADAETVEQRHHILGHVMVGERSRPVCAASLRATIRDDDPVRARELGALLLELHAIAGSAMQQQQRWAVALGLDIEPDAANRERPPRGGWRVSRTRRRGPRCHARGEQHGMTPAAAARSRRAHRGRQKRSARPMRVMSGSTVTAVPPLGSALSFSQRMPPEMARERPIGRSAPTEMP